MTEAIPSLRPATIQRLSPAPGRPRLAVGRARQQAPQPLGAEPSRTGTDASAPVRLGWVDPVTGASLEIVLDVTPAMLRRLEGEGFRVEVETERQAS